MPVINPCNPEDFENIAKGISEDMMGKIKIEPITIDLDPTPQSEGDAFRKSTLGSFGSIRTMRGWLGDDLSARVHNDVTRELTKMHNSLSDSIKLQDEIYKPMLETGSVTKNFWNKIKSFPEKPNKELMDAIELVDNQGRWKGSTEGFSPSVVEAAPKLRKHVQEVYEKLIANDSELRQTLPDPDTFFEYYARARQQGGNRGIFWKADPNANQDFIGRINADQARFFFQHEVTGGLNNADALGTVAVNSIINSYHRAAYIQKAITKAEKETMLPFFNAKIADVKGYGKSLSVNDPIGYAAWKEFTHHLMGGVTASDMRWAGHLNEVTKMFGYQTDTRGLYQVSNFISQMGYMGTMGAPFIGGRPASAVRQLGQLIPSWAQFGSKTTLQAMKESLEDVTTGGGKLMSKYAENGILTSHIDSAVQSMDAAKNAGKMVNAIAENNMKVIAMTDKYVRMVTARSAEIEFDIAMSRGGVSTLRGGPELKAEIKRRVEMGNIEDAKMNYIMHNVADLQFVYGKANRSSSLRGAIGNAIAMFTSYPLNTAEMMRMFVRRAVTNPETGEWTVFHGDPMPLMRMVGATAAITYAGSEMLNADLRSMMFYTAFPQSLMLPKALADTWMAGTTNIEYLSGSLFNIGESSFHKQRREGYERQLAHDWGSYLPGFAAYNDLRKVTDEGYWAHLLALTPKGAELDQIAKERRAKARAERSMLE